MSAADAAVTPSASTPTLASKSFLMTHLLFLMDGRGDAPSPDCAFNAGRRRRFLQLCRSAGLRLIGNTVELRPLIPRTQKAPELSLRGFSLSGLIASLRSGS